MVYEIFKKKVQTSEKRKETRPLMVAMDRHGRLRINQGFYDTMIEESFKKAVILVDYDHKKIALKMFKGQDTIDSNAKTLTHGDRTKVAFISFVTVRNALNLKFPFIRNATWDAKEKLIEFSWKED